MTATVTLPLKLLISGLIFWSVLALPFTPGTVRKKPVGRNGTILCLLPARTVQYSMCHVMLCCVVYLNLRYFDELYSCGYVLNMLCTYTNITLLIDTT